jgi:hypothetical protein
MEWISVITKDLQPELASRVLALDPDQLLSEETVSATLRSRGYEILSFEDEVAFRLEYETKYRDEPDTPLIIIHPGERKEDVPFDLLSGAEVVSPSLASLFPNLSLPVIGELEKGDLAVLYEAQQKAAPSLSSDSETKSFVLIHVFQIAPEIIRSSSDFLKVLMGIHYGGRQMPNIFAEWMADRLGQVASLSDWPLKDLITDRAKFLQFMQERWPLFLARTAGQEAQEYADLSVAGSPDIPFDHHDVRIYIDNLFLEESLVPIEFNLSGELPDWVKVGIVGTEGEDKFARLKRLLENVASDIPDHSARHRDWMAFAFRWAEVSVRWNSLTGNERKSIEKIFYEAQVSIDSNFGAWMDQKYSGLHSQPPVPPVMLHHVPRMMARHMNGRRVSKSALIVVDGLALDQWHILRQRVRESRELTIHEDSVFAWVPTITSVSRQAIFSGKPPVQFASHIGTTSKEHSLWSQFWTDHGITGNQVTYRKGLGDPSDLTDVEAIIENPQVCVVGLVVDKIDKMMHGAELGMAGLHNQIGLWSRNGYLTDLCTLLVKNGFVVYITSDHGNVECFGIGRPSEGAIAEERGERARIYPHLELRRQIKNKFPSSTEWPSVGLPNDFLPLLAAGREAFVSTGKTVVGHGGASLEEVIVPLIRIEGIE